MGYRPLFVFLTWDAKRQETARHGVGNSPDEICSGLGNGWVPAP